MFSISQYGHIIAVSIYIAIISVAFKSFHQIAMLEACVVRNFNSFQNFQRRIFGKFQKGIARKYGSYIALIIGDDIRLISSNRKIKEKEVLEI